MEQEEEAEEEEEPSVVGVESEKRDKDEMMNSARG